LRRTSERLSQLYNTRNNISIWNWIQKKYQPQKSNSTSGKALEYIVDETMLKVGSEYIWLGWNSAQKQVNSSTFLDNESKERNMFVAKRFIQGLVKIRRRHPVSTGRSRYVVPNGLKILKSRSSHSSLLREKPYRKGNAVYQGWNREFRRLLSV
jgi:putative transposase